MIEGVTSELARQLRTIILLAVALGACLGAIVAVIIFMVLS